MSCLDSIPMFINFRLIATILEIELNIVFAYEIKL